MPPPPAVSKPSLRLHLEPPTQPADLPDPQACVTGLWPAHHVLLLLSAQLAFTSFSYFSPLFLFYDSYLEVRERHPAASPRIFKV